MAKNFTTLSIIIPVYNEEKTIGRVLDSINQVELINNIKKEIIVINDCSTDNTLNVVSEYISSHTSTNVQVYSQEKNSGKGSAIHSGIAKASGEYIIIQDADLEYDPREYNLLIKPVVEGYADVVFGSRFMGGNPHRILFYWHSVGNRLLTRLSNMLNNLNFTDIEVCYKLFDAEMIKSLKLKEKRFGFEPEVTAKISRIKNVRIYEVGVSYYGRTYADGKKIKWKDGFRAIYCIIKYSLFSR